MPFVPDRKTSGFVPDSTASSQGAGGGIVFTSRGGVESPQGQAKVKTATAKAEKQVDLQFEQQQNAAVQQVVDSLIASGTPLLKITPQQLFENENINPKMSLFYNQAR